MSSPKINFFITGGTGYIGGSVISRLLRHPNAYSFHITALVRTEEKAEKLKTLGIHPVIGSYTNKDLSFLTEAASKADVVIAVADGDNFPAAKAILDGMKIKYEKSGKAPILIHTSGSAIIADDARGEHADHITYSDLDVEKLNALPESVIHRNVDIPIIKADQEGYIKSYIVAPTTVFGEASGLLVDLGVQNKHSIQLPYQIKASIAIKQGGYIKKGINRWSAVDLEETVDLYIVLFDAIRKNPDAVSHGAEGYYFTESTDYSGKEAAQAIGEVLFELGIAKTPEPRSFTDEELNQIYQMWWPSFSSNCYAKADRSRALGWKSTKGKEDFLASVKSEVKWYAASTSSSKA